MIPELEDSSEEESGNGLEERINKALKKCDLRDVKLVINNYLCRFSNRQENCLKCPYDYGGKNGSA
jgi:hypothetical protein